MNATNGSTEKGAAKKSTPKTDVELSAIDKVRKLMEFSTENGATEAEVENAMKLAQRLMLKHNLEMGDIKQTVNDIDATVIVDTWKKGTESKLFLHDLLSVVAQAFSCKVVRAGTTAKRLYKIVGLKEDREMTESTFEKILPQVRNLTKTRFKESDKSLSAVRFTISYQAGFISGLAEKLATDKATLMKSKDGRAFEMIIVTKDTLISDWLATNLPIKQSERVIKVDPATFKKGKDDGADKGLNEKLPQAEKTEVKKPETTKPAAKASTAKKEKEALKADVKKAQLKKK
jgi:hypothetical protein